MRGGDGLYSGTFCKFLRRLVLTQITQHFNPILDIKWLPTMACHEIFHWLETIFREAFRVVVRVPWADQNVLVHSCKVYIGYFFHKLIREQT